MIHQQPFNCRAPLVLVRFTPSVRGRATIVTLVGTAHLPEDNHANL